LEYAWVSEADFCLAQVRTLENFAKDEVRLYRCAKTSTKWRDAARANLKRCVTELNNKIAQLSCL